MLVSAGNASSDRAQGGIAAATLPEDSPRLHALDTLAAGAGLCERTTNSRISNGKGILEAARAGARVADMEFVQFHPTAFAGPHTFLITEALRGAGAHIIDAEGNRFIDELLARDQVARAIAMHPGQAFISVTHLDAEVPRRSFPNFMRNCRM